VIPGAAESQRRRARPRDPHAERAAGEHTASSFGRRWGALYCVLVLLGVAVLVGPSNLVWSHEYMQPPVGDHIQLTYYLWLWWHSITTFSHAPWVDPFQFAATGHHVYQACCGPLVLVSLPVQALWGAVAAFNAVFYATFVAAAGCMYLWTRSLGAPRLAAAVAGFAYAFAPFRLVQKWHENALLAFLLPLILYFAERALRGPRTRTRIYGWLCAASVIALAASGEAHLVVFFAPVLAAYVAVRGWRADRDRLKELIGPTVTLLAGALVFSVLTYWFTIKPSLRAAQGIGNNAAFYAPRPADLFRKTATERTAYPGIVTAVLALAGVAAAVRRRADRVLVGFLLLLTAAAYAIAVLPSLGRFGLGVYRRVPVLSGIQVPGRFVIVAALALAALAAIGLGQLRPRHAAVAAGIGLALMSVIVLDGRAFVGDARAYPSDPNLMPAVPRGSSVLDLPPFEGGHAGGSRYALQIIYTPGPRVGGYSVVVTPQVFAAQQTTVPLASVPPDPCRWRQVAQSLRFQYVAVYRDLFGPDRLQWHGDGRALVAALNEMPGFRRVSTVKDVDVFRLDTAALPCRTR